MNAFQEDWLPVPGFEEFYLVSNTGEVRSLDRQVRNGRGCYLKKGRLLAKTKTSTGYWKVELFGIGGRKSFKVHRLVAIAFIEKVDGKDLINHKDGNPLNNRVDNLEWCTQSENMKHAYETKLMKSNFIKYRDEITERYLSDKTVNIKQLAREYKCSDASIRKHFRSEGINIRGLSHIQDKYKINRKKLIEKFKQGESNKNIAIDFNTNSQLIASYRYKFKKGVLKL